MPQLLPIPTNYKLPLFQAAVDGTMAGNLTESQPALMVGQAFLGGDATVAAAAGMKGNGALALDIATPVRAGAALGVYKVVFTSPTAFTVTPPVNGMAQGNGVVGTAYDFLVKFLVAAGATAFAVGDEFDVTVSGLPQGTGNYNKAVPVGSVAAAKALYGVGSMLARMFEVFFANNTTQQIWCAAVPRPAASVKATGAIQILTAPTASGVLFPYIAGQVAAFTVNSTDTLATIATNLAAAINAMPSLPVKAAVDAILTNQVNLTARWHGLTGNDIVIGFNYLGAYGGQAFPAGLTTGVTPMAGGVGNPDFSGVIAAIAPRQFRHVAMPYTDTASLQVWDNDYGFGPGGRWSYTRQQYGIVYNYLRTDYSDGLVWGLAHNSAVISTMALEPTAPTPVWEWTAAYCGEASAALLADPAAPLQTLELLGCLPAPLEDRFANDELNNLTNGGLAVQGIAPSGNAMILREALQYQLNQYGQADDAFGLVTVLSNLAELLDRMRSAVTTKWPRHKLAPDGTKYGPLQKIVTPKIAIGEVISELRKAEYDGLTANVDAAIKVLSATINDNNSNRLDVLYPPQLMGQLRQFDVLAQFRLQYDTTSAAA